MGNHRPPSRHKDPP